MKSKKLVHLKAPLYESLLNSKERVKRKIKSKNIVKALVHKKQLSSFTQVLLLSEKHQMAFFTLGFNP